MQAALVAMAQQGNGDFDEPVAAPGNGDAATTLLVQLRPGLIRLARWVAVAADLAWPDAIDEVRAVFFETLYRHPLERRPHSIAANLLLDTRQRVIRAHRRTSQRVGLAAVGPQPPSGSEVGAAGDVDPISRLLVTQVLRAGLDQLPGSDESRALTATIAYRAWVLDQSRSDIARDLGLNPEVVTSRLHRLKTNIAQQKSA
jgi:DNA-directed RNA polymerase specialized sigma24 family protein